MAGGASSRMPENAVSRGEDGGGAALLKLPYRRARCAELGSSGGGSKPAQPWNDCDRRDRRRCILWYWPITHLRRRSNQVSTRIRKSLIDGRHEVSRLPLDAVESPVTPKFMSGCCSRSNLGRKLAVRFRLPATDS